MTQRQKLFNKIQVLNETIWENRVRKPEVDSWLANFATSGTSGTDERAHALHLLANFMYFGSHAMRELMKALFRDLYKYPIVADIRKSHDNTTDSNLIATLFQDELCHTRFVGVGNPSESGCHLLYYFRQENGLPKSAFIHTHEIFERYGRSGTVTVRDPQIRRYIFIDDLCGSGETGVRYSQDILMDLKDSCPNASTAYYVLFGTTVGLRYVKNEARFDTVQAIFELDESFKSLEPMSRYFVDCVKGIDRAFARDMCLRHGSRLEPSHPLGFDDGQMLLGFHHNIPDNTLPIIWHTGSPGAPWKAIFRRYPKLYG